MLSRHNEFPQPLLIRSDCLIGTFLPGWGLCQRGSLATPGSHSPKPPVPSANRAAQDLGQSRDMRGIAGRPGGLGPPTPPGLGHIT